MRGRTSKCLLAVLCCLTALVFAQEIPPRTDDKPASVEGTVINALTGEPLVRAHVTLRGFPNGAEQKYGALTNMEGRFTITSISPGALTATAERVGYVSSGGNPGPRPEEVNLRPGDQKNDLKLKLTPTGAIVGRVVDADGEPMEFVPVTAIASSRSQQSTTSDDKGNFRIGGLAPGKYRIEAKPMHSPFPAEIRTDGSAEVHYSRTYYPNSPVEKSAARVEVSAASEVAGIEIRLLRTPLVRVSGTISGIPLGVQNVNVVAREASRYGVGTMARPDGTFQIWRLDPGKYRLVATRSDASRIASAPVEVEVGNSNIDNIELRLVPPVNIPGQIEYDDDQARQEPASVVSRQQGSKPPETVRTLQILLRITGETAGVRIAQVASNGSFTLEQVQPERYTVLLSWGPYVKSMRLGQTDIEGAILDLRNGAAGSILTVGVSSAFATLSGIVSDSKGPFAGARVVLALDGPEIYSSQPRMAVTDAGGAYSLKGIPPGKYKLVALDQSDAAPFMLGMPEEYQDEAETIDIRANDKLNKNLKLRAADASSR